MCIIVYKKLGAKIPSKEILKNCFENNPDGAGFMCVMQNKVSIQKGFMNFDAFFNALKRNLRKTGEKIPYVLHFRISTQGGVRPDCTHPFPLSEELKDLRALKLLTDFGIAHNGIISLTSDYTKKELDYNDTMEFIIKFLTLIIENNQFYKNKNTLNLISRLTNSKFAILDKDNHCELIGNGWIEKNNVCYSNDTFSKKEKELILNNYYFEDYLEYYYDYDSGLYKFDEDSCPLLNDFEDEYCQMCIQYPKCNLR